MLSCPLFLRMFYGVMNQEVRHQRLGRNLPTLTEVSPSTPSIVLLSLGRACLLHPLPQMRRIRSCPTMAEQAVISHLAETEEPKTCNWINLGQNHTLLLLSRLLPSSGTIWKSEMAFSEHIPLNAMRSNHNPEITESESPMTRNSQLKTQ